MQSTEQEAVYEPKVFADHAHLRALSPAETERQHQLYGGYLRASNAIQNRICSLVDTRDPCAPTSGRLHDLYFEALGPGRGSTEALDQLIVAYGGKKKLVGDMVALATCGAGWAVLLQEAQTGALRVAFFADHRATVPVGQRVLLVLDCWEHPCAPDGDVDRVRYANAVMLDVNWAVVAGRLDGSC